MITIQIDYSEICWNCYAEKSKITKPSYFLVTTDYCGENDTNEYACEECKKLLTDVNYGTPAKFVRKLDIVEA